MMPRLRVLHLIDSLARAGAEQSMAALAPHLIAEGVDLHLGYLFEREGLRADFQRAGVRVTSLDNGDPGRRGWLGRSVKLIEDLRPDVVHTTLFEADLAGRRAAARCGVPCVSSLVNTAYGRTEMNRDGVGRVKVRAAQAADALTARHVTQFHAVTRHVADIMSRRLLIPRGKIEVIHRGRDAAALGRRSAERNARVRRLLGIPFDAPLVLAVGRHEPQKGLDVLMRALPAVRNHVPRIRVLVAGREGRSTPGLVELVHQLRLADVVTFLGMRDDVPDLLAAADLFAFSSFWEGAGGTLLEAMALECPIVSSDLPALRETINESTAALVPAGKAAEFGTAVINVLNDRPGATARAYAARQRFEERFTVESSARQLALLYRRAALMHMAKSRGMRAC
jgi:glycosyltransferase involved in cell wall biosynthesis